MENLLGRTVEDVITGFRGVVTGQVSYLTGCQQVLLTPRCKEDGTVVEPRWYDLDRVRVDQAIAPVVVGVTAAGSDLAAPVR